jgi:hypothetical protein
MELFEHRSIDLVWTNWHRIPIGWNPLRTTRLSRTHGFLSTLGSSHLENPYH